MSTMSGDIEAMSEPVMQAARFIVTSCSQCGCLFGPSAHGFSFCSHHRGLTPWVGDAPNAVGRSWFAAATDAASKSVPRRIMTCAADAGAPNAIRSGRNTKSEATMPQEPTSTITIVELVKLSSRLTEHAEHIVNAAAAQVEQDIRTAAKAAEELARLREAILKIATWCEDKAAAHELVELAGVDD